MNWLCEWWSVAPVHAANLVAKKDVLHFVVFCFNINLRPVDIESTSFRCTLLGCSSRVKSQEQNGDNGKVSPKLSIRVCFCYVQIKDGFSRPQGPLIFNMKTSYRKILDRKSHRREINAKNYSITFEIQ